MYNSAKTETRIINFDGTIIVLNAEKFNAKRYAVRIDGIFSGHLERKNNALILSMGTEIKEPFLQKISEIFNVDKQLAIN
ncbi:MULTISPECIES: hypothetical protein [unclassified Pedobacter]|uniref:hypothetical protein n=1 Tax=unclassified Pedobacter TaxID=2628915 RepID=UPI001E4DF94E|nr:MULTISPECIES: hypothetical protein [unclassified Pedobacter]